MVRTSSIGLSRTDGVDVGRGDGREVRGISQQMDVCCECDTERFVSGRMMSAQSSWVLQHDRRDVVVSSMSWRLKKAHGRES